jgi:sigma-E factor negative regulatory protein RseA
MNTNEMTREQISALADGELTDRQVEAALATLRQPEGRANWEIYHQIGDVLRCDDMAVKMSPGFTARMAARLELEPAIVAPMDNPLLPEKHAVGIARFSASIDTVSSRAKRWAIPGMIAAAVASAAFVATPQLMVAMKGESAASGSETMVASAGTAQAIKVSSTVSTTAGQFATVPSTAAGEVVLRDPRIDDYLLAHQRFSPSMYSTAQFARSATFETAPGK